MMPELRIRVAGRPAVLRLPMGDGAPKLTEGLGGWETVNRPKRIAATRFTTSAPFVQEVPVRLDGFRQDRSVQPQIDRLIRLSRPLRAGVDPPILRIGGPGIQRRTLHWVISGITWGDTLQAPGVGVVRQDLTISFLQHVRSDSVRVRRPRPRHTVYTVRRGDNWRKIARKRMGDASKWKEIARANGSKPRDPSVDLKPGRRVRIPR